MSVSISQDTVTGAELRDARTRLGWSRWRLRREAEVAFLSIVMLEKSGPLDATDASVSAVLIALTKG